MTFVLLMLIISIFVNLLMFIPAFIFKTDKLTDLSYAITFILLGVFGYSLSSKTIIQLGCLVMVILWALRLGIFLFIRINKIKKDSRFDGKRENFYKFLGFWLLQGITVFIILVPSIVMWNQDVNKINLISLFGVLVFLVGLFIESIADAQKYQFNAKKTKTWIDSGIWRMSRHPNYLGEIMIWVGIYLYVIPSLDWSLRLIALIGPVYIVMLLVFVSGIPILEKSGNKKWGDKKTYQEYKSNVPVLFPTLKSIYRIFK